MLGIQNGRAPAMQEIVLHHSSWHVPAANHALPRCLVYIERISVGFVASALDARARVCCAPCSNVRRTRIRRVPSIIPKGVQAWH